MLCWCFFSYNWQLFKCATMNDNAASSSNDSSIQELIQQLDSESGQERKNARAALVQLGKEVIPSLVKHLSNPKRMTHWEILKTIDEIKDPEAIPFLLEALDEESGDLRWIASVGLIHLGFQVAKPLLLSLTKKKELSVFVLAGSHHVFYELNKKRKIPKDFPIKELLKAFRYPGRKGHLMVIVYKILEEL